MGSFDILTLVFLALAVFVIFKLRSVLGERTGAEPPPFEGARREVPPTAAREDRLINVPSHEIDGEVSEPVFRWQGYAEEGSALAEAFDSIAALDPTFHPKSFATGAKAAYEMIVTAFNNGDRKSLKNLLSREMFDNFSHDIADRESRGETVQSSFVSIDKVDLVHASTSERVAQVTINFESQMISATKDRGGAVIDGSVDKVASVTDTWTFARDTGTKDPNWRLVATGDGE